MCYFLDNPPSHYSHNRQFKIIKALQVTSMGLSENSFHLKSLNLPLESTVWSLSVRLEILRQKWSELERSANSDFVCQTTKKRRTTGGVSSSGFQILKFPKCLNFNEITKFISAFFKFPREMLTELLEDGRWADPEKSRGQRVKICKQFELFKSELHLPLISVCDSTARVRNLNSTVWKWQVGLAN